MITIKHATFHYGGENGTGDGLEDINLTIKTGEVVVLCGESGCGKTTITRLINGLIPQFYEGEFSGEVLIDDYNVSTHELAETAAKVGSVFQNPKSQFFNIDTTGELSFGCENLGLSREEIKKRYDRTVEDMKIQALCNRNIFELSGGEKQQIACGSVYATEPEVFVMDEPSSNLDKKAMKRLSQILTKMKQEGKTIVISEHRLHYLMDLADRFIYVKQGRIEKEYTNEELRALSEEELAKLGLRSTNLAHLHTENHIEEFDKTPSIEVLDLGCSRQNARILDIDRIQLPKHSIIAVIGDNGCGKSTLAEALCGLIPSSGSVAFDKVYLNEKQRRKNSFLVMQDVNRQLFSDSCLEEVMLNAHVTEDEAKHTLDQLGLLDYANRHPASLSGGQKQRTAIAAALCAGKQILFYDEPTSGLDRIGMERFGNLLLQTKDQVEISVIITHDPELIAQCCTHVLHMERGHVIGFYPLDEEGMERVKGYFFSPSDENFSKKRDKRSNVGKILSYAGSHKKSIALAFVLMAIGAAASVVPYVAVGKIVQSVLEGQSITLASVKPLLLAIGIAELIYAIFYMCGLIVSHHAAYGTLENLRIRLQERMEETSLGYLLGRGTGDIKKLFTDDIESIEALLAHMIPEGLANLSIPLLGLIILIRIDWQIALLTALMVGIGLSVSGQMYSVGISKMGSYFAAAKRMNNAIVEYVNGMEVVRVFNRQKDSAYRYELAVDEYRDYALDWYKVSWPWMALYKSLFANIVMYSLPFGAIFVVLGEISVSQYVLALMLSFGIGPLLSHCMAFIGAIPQVSFKIQSLEHALESVPVKTTEDAFRGKCYDIEFQDVHFAYKDVEVVKGVSFTAKEGTTTALVGMSGSGKSTLAKLLVHYYEISSGAILIGGQDIRKMSLDELNRQIAYVSQSVFLFNKSIMENIRMGRPEATDEEVKEAARKAECEEFILQLEHGYDTVAGAAGGALSGGQRQRIAFARAILKDAPIIVLDEATASVDAENEKKMRAAIGRIIQGKTVLVIAHKMRSIQNVDQIVVIGNGEIHGIGTHEELVKSCEDYQRLTKLSSLTESWNLRRKEEA
ncbi:MAG: ATP-binding cassette domain-containing protein [Lachnospiraceae bacterium]|nr:ATP-binding cassette domain-containing protein [Lachnospiraceae bacterium]